MSTPESPRVPQQSNSNDMVSTGSELITSTPDTPVTDSSSSAPGPSSGRKRRRIDISDRSISPQTPPAGGILVDEKENALCRKFTENTCGCKKINGRPCSTQFSAEYIIEMRAQASLLTHDELDMVILGSLMTTLNRSENIVDGRHKPKKITLTTHTTASQFVQSPLAFSMALDPKRDSSHSGPIIWKTV